MFIGKFSKPSIITYIGIITGVVGIYFTPSNISLAIVCLFVCAICDFFDGKFARLFKRNDQEQRFGIAIDSLADTLMFAVLPCVILFSISQSVLSVIVATVYIACGITRLAIFTSEARPNRKTIYYKGLPITCAGFFIPPIYLICVLLLPELIEPIFYATYFVLAVLFVLNIKVKKP
jgi:CDP-diacylglycerol--serine O-phosphatidyltransferase